MDSLGLSATEPNRLTGHLVLFMEGAVSALWHLTRQGHAAQVSTGCFDIPLFTKHSAADRGTSALRIVTPGETRQKMTMERQNKLVWAQEKNVLRWSLGLYLINKQRFVLGVLALSYPKNLLKTLSPSLM